MNKWIWTKANVIHMEDALLWAYNMFEVPFQIKEAWLNCTLMLNKKNINDSADLWYSELMGVCKEYVERMKPSVEINWENVLMSPQALLLVVNSLATEAMERGSQLDKDIFKIRVESPDEAFNEFKKKNKDKIKELERMEKKIKQSEEKSNWEDDISLQDVMDAIRWIKTYLSDWHITNRSAWMASWGDWFDDIINAVWEKKKNTSRTPSQKIKISTDMGLESQVEIIEQMSSKNIL